MRRLICTGCGGSASFNFIESLRLSGEPYYVVGVDTDKYHIKLSNANKTYLVPKCTENGYIEVLNEIIKKEKIEFLHAQPDPEVREICRNRDKLNCKTFFPDFTEILLAQDKMLFNLKMRSKKVPVPFACEITTPEKIKEVFSLFKGKMWLRAMQGAGSLASLPVTEEEQAVMWIDYWSTRGIGWGDFMMSEYLPGKEYAFQSLWYEGELITSAARERIEYLFQNRMPSGQSSTPTIAKSVHNKRVNEISTLAIKALSNRPHGIYCVDLKEDKNGTPNVTEINIARFFTTSNFFSFAGSNMPHLFVKLGCGESVPEQLKYNAVKDNLFWIRQIDMSNRMVEESEL